MITPTDSMVPPTRTGLTPSGEGRLVLVAALPSGLREFDLSDGKRYEVGRERTALVCLDDPSVSRQHAVLIPGPEGVRVEDLGSSNHTFLNNRLIDGVVFAGVGDAIRFGNVSAQLHHIRSTVNAARLVLADELDRRILDEAERSLRTRSNLALVAIEVSGRGNALQVGRRAIGEALRSTDLLALRKPGRVDALLLDCTKEEGVHVAKRIHAALEKAGVSSRLGAASFPGDAASPESLVLAAEVAMEAVSSGVGVAGEAFSVFKVGQRDVLVADQEMFRVFGVVQRVAAVSMSVLVTGETGSGKDIVAEAIHRLGPRAQRALVKLNCAAVPEPLLESELFGHEKGAFTGALSVKPGLIEQADGGTLFLDEIGDMPLGLQAKLLRVLEDRAIRRVGGLTEKVIDVRLVAATHKDLAKAVKAGTFREDLFYRLSAIVIAVPPLRQRLREILPLAERLLAEAAEEFGRPAPSLAPETAQALLAHPWPGNIRELRNVMARTLANCPGDTIDPTYLPTELLEPKPAPDGEPGKRASLDDELLKLERARIVEALESCDGNQTQAAKKLGMPRRTLVYKLTTLGIRRPRRTSTPR